jgi:hypothetical protein
VKELTGLAFVQRTSNENDTTNVLIREGVRDGHGSIYLYIACEVSLTTEEARHLARCLLRAAKRVEAKTKEAAVS